MSPADCRSAERTEDHTERVSEEKTLGTDGAAGTEPVDQPDILSLEDRILVALARRGERPLALFLQRAIWSARNLGGARMPLGFVSDEDFVRALEAEAFS